MSRNYSKGNSLPRLGDFIRPSVSLNKVIVCASSTGKLGDLFDTSFNAKVGVLGRTTKDVDQLVVIAERLLQIVPKEKLAFVNFIIVDNKINLSKELFVSEEPQKEIMSAEEINEMKQNAILFLSQVVQKGCVTYAHFKDKNWNKDELRNELEKMKEHLLRSLMDKGEVKQKKQVKPLLFSKKKGADAQCETTGNLKKLNSIEEHEKDDRAKLLFTAPRARENSLPSDLIKTMIAEGGKSYSFLDLLAADGYETNDLETFEEQVILRLDKLKDHILDQFNPVFNELNEVRRRLRHLSEQSATKKDDRKSIMKQR